MENIINCDNLEISNEVYQPGKLKDLCLEKVASIYSLSQFTRQDLPMTVISHLHRVAKEQRHLKYTNNLIREFNSHMFDSMPYKFSPNLFNAIIYPDEDTQDFNISHIVMSDWPEN